MCLLPVAALTVQAEFTTWLDEIKAQAVPWAENKQITTEGYYKIDVKKDESYQFILGDPANGLVNLDIIDVNGESVASSTTNKFDSNKKETVMHIKLRKGTYYVHLYNTVVTASFKRINDTNLDLEPNNKPQQALSIPYNTLVYGRNNESPSDTDYYTFTLKKPQKVTFTMEPWGFPYGDSYHIRFDRFITLNNEYATTSSVYLPAGTYTFKVETTVFRNSNAQYAFRVDTAPVPNGLLESITGTTNLFKGQTINGIVSARVQRSGQKHLKMASIKLELQ